MGIKFQVVPHDVLPGVETVELLLDGQMVAMIYPNDEEGVKIVSAHFDGVVEDDGVGSTPPIPHVLFRFRFQDFHFEDGRMVRDGQQSNE